ncbi:MAG: phosphate transport system regulatory protein PhoU [Ignavibacteria bacterium]|nr:MAG: phosphate transport system regulatory protein PhoU [Ignavibacteria bacterium]
MTEHILKRFDDQLEKLEKRIGKMADLVQQQVSEAMHALQTSDTSLAQTVIEMDDKVDLYDTKIEKLCMRLLALQQPVAADLRMVLSSLSVNRNLERMGDAAVNIAERVAMIAPHAELIQKTQVVKMGEVAADMIRDAMKAFVNVDVGLARSVAVRDSVVDEFDQQNFDRLTARMKKSPDLAEAASHLLLVSRNIERLADEATNIAEETVFIADAKFVKHQGWGQKIAEDDQERSE